MITSLQVANAYEGRAGMLGHINNMICCIQRPQIIHKHTWDLREKRKKKYQCFCRVASKRHILIPQFIFVSVLQGAMYGAEIIQHLSPYGILVPG